GLERVAEDDVLEVGQRHPGGLGVGPADQDRKAAAADGDHVGAALDDLAAEEVNGDLGGTDRKSRELLGHEVGLLAGLSQPKPNPPSAVPLASRRRESYHSWASIQDAGGLRLRRRGRAASPPR